MSIQNVIGELLYIGIVAEKGRCYGTVWKIGYKTVLRKHIYVLKELQKSLVICDEKKFFESLEDLKKLCSENHEVGKFYNFSNEPKDLVYSSENYCSINSLMDALFSDLVTEINKTFIDKKKVYDILCVLHNLPRVYLGKENDTFCCICQDCISAKDALNYSYDIMNSEMKIKYEKFFEN